MITSDRPTTGVSPENDQAINDPGKPVGKMRFWGTLAGVFFFWSFFFAGWVAFGGDLPQGQVPFYQTDPSVIVGIVVKAENVSGAIVDMVDRRFLPEGSSLAGAGAVIFNNHNAYIVVDLKKPTSVAAISLQADSDDVFRLRYSLDGKNWEELAAFPRSSRGAGLRTRNEKLPFPVTARYIVVDFINGRPSSAISELCVYRKPPHAWPPTKSGENSAAVLFWLVKSCRDVCLFILIPIVSIWLITQVCTNRLPWTGGLFLFFVIGIVAVELFGFLTNSRLEYYSVYRYVIHACVLSIAIFLFPYSHLARKTTDSSGGTKPGVVIQEPAGQTFFYRLVLGALGFVAVLSFYDFGTFGGKGFVHYHEFTHYYLGSKYFPELGYHHLYAAVLAAEKETGGQFEVQVVRDLRNNELVAAGQIESVIDSIPRHFSPTRWREFKNDFVFFRPRIGALDEVVQDYGYNPSPIWTAMGYGLTNLLSTIGCPVQQAVYLLASLDIILLAALFWLIQWAFGFDIMIFAVIFWAVNPFEAYGYTRGGFLRQDWFFAVVASFCFFKKDRYALSGMSIAYAVGTRLFPAVFVLFPVFSAFRAWRKMKKMPGPLLTHIVFFMLTLLILWSGSVAVTGGLRSWKNFADKIIQHNEGIYTNHIAFRNLWIYNVDKTYKNYNNEALWGQEKQRWFRKYKPAVYTLLAGGLFFFFYVFRNESVLRGMAFSAFLPFFFFYPANYYYVFLLPVIFYLKDERSECFQVFFFLLLVGGLGRIFIKEDDVYNFFLSVNILVMFCFFARRGLAGRSAVASVKERDG